MNYGLEKPKLSFLKKFGAATLIEPPLLEEKFGSFLEEKFLSKELSGRIVET